MRPKTNLTALIGPLLLSLCLSNCGSPDDGGKGDIPYVTVRVAGLSIEARYINVTGEADCYPGPYPVTYRWNAAALSGCFKIPAQCFVGAPSYPLSLMSIKDSGEVIQNGTGTVMGSTENLRPPLGPTQTITLKMVPRTPTYQIKGFKPNGAWPELLPCQ